MANKFFHGLESFGRFLERSAALEVAIVDEAANVTSHILHDKVRSEFGDSSKLAELSDATQAERTRLGFTADEPLLRDGSLLRDSVERLHEHLIAGVGSSEPIMAYSEFGFFNVRAGVQVPPRPVFELALKESEPEVEAILEAAVDAVLGGRGGAVTLLEGVTRLVD